MSSFDREMMSRALQLAAKGRFTSSPNPTVGCVITMDDVIVSEGFTCPAGGNHGEIEALQRAGEVAGATVYVSLEPCSHHGKTGPCADALIAAAVARVAVAVEDPNPVVAGAGIKKLRDSGVEVQVGLLEGQARVVNKGFFMRHEQGRPWVTVKMAASLDGRTAMASGQSQWITAPAARTDVQILRAESCAVITGIGTQKMDDPSLTVRMSYSVLDPTVEDCNLQLRQPLRVVVDARAEMSSEARMLQQPGSTLVAVADETVQRERAKELQCAGAEVLFVPAVDGRLNLQCLLERLAERGCNRVMVEAGAGLAGAFVAEGLFDEVVCYWAPKLFGSAARPMFELPIETIDAHLALSLMDVRRIGEDLRLTLHPDKDY